MLATHYLQAGRTAEAAALLNETLALDPERPLRSHTYSALAQTRLAAGERIEAERDARLSLAEWDMNHEAWNALGAALAGLGNNAEAEKAFLRAAEIEPTGDGPLVNLGLLRLGTGNAAGAAEALESAVKRRPTDYALGLLCRARAAAGDAAGAARACKGALELNPARPDTLLLLGRLYTAMGAAEPAGLCLDEAGRLAGETPELRAARAELLKLNSRKK
jgi:Flp pilus assembly protein TadD